MVNLFQGKTKLRIISIIAILAISCNIRIADWQTFDFNYFKLKVPRDWRKFDMQGVDAFIGGLTNGRDSLLFYFGSNVSGFQGNNENYLFAQDTINGKIAEIKIPQKDRLGSIELFINKAENENKFVLASSYNSNQSLILRIFKSVIFQSSDTTKNGSLTTTKFKKYPFGSGSTIFQANCTACHARHKRFAGPALTPELINSRTKEWLYTFFKDRKNLKKDSAYLAGQKEAGKIDCIQFTDYSKEDIEQLVSYLKGL